MIFLWLVPFLSVMSAENLPQPPITTQILRIESYSQNGVPLSQAWVGNDPQRPADTVLSHSAAVSDVIHAFAVLRTPIDLCINPDHIIGRAATHAMVPNTSAPLQPGVYVIRINAIDASSKDPYDIAVEIVTAHSSPEQHGVVHVLQPTLWRGLQQAFIESREIQIEIDNRMVVKKYWYSPEIIAAQQKTFQHIDAKPVTPTVDTIQLGKIVKLNGADDVFVDVVEMAALNYPTLDCKGPHTEDYCMNKTGTLYRAPFSIVCQPPTAFITYTHKVDHGCT